MATPANEIVHQGWLWKSPPAKVTLFRPRWSRRWFILKSGSYPNQFVLEYFHDESARRSKRSINLDECEQICGPLNVQDRHHRYAFHLRTPNRTYYLAANTEQDMKKWIEALCQVCALKMMEDDSEGVVYVRKPTNENSTPTPLANEPTTNQNESDGSSPTPSNKSPSGPYIPISECITGKPIRSNDVPYYNISFQFPPKVNWATHPVESPNAPPRPPKKNSSRPTNLDDNWTEHDDSETPSTSPSLQSPPGSAGGLYCNIPDPTENKTAGASQHHNNQASTSGSSSTPSAIPPKVDRNLKPEVKKPSGGHFTLSSTPAQIKFQSGLQNSGPVRISNTLPNRGGRRNGPIALSPQDNRSPNYPRHEYETTELFGTYMTLDPATLNDGEKKSQTLRPTTNKTTTCSGSATKVETSVEYRLIDHVKTEALNQMRKEREKQFHQPKKTNTARH